MQLINDSLGLSKPIWRKRTLDFGERSKFSTGPRGPVAGCDVQLFNEINSVQQVFAGGASEGKGAGQDTVPGSGEGPIQ